MFATDDTIAAIATPPGRGAIGIVRLSGAGAVQTATRLIDRTSDLRPRVATLARVLVPAGPGHPAPEGEHSRAVDSALVTYFPGPASYTGEDLVEISAHGSPFLLQQILTAAIQSGARLARPGEFTLRAFLNGRLDLVQAEAVADLIDAATPAQARLAFDQLEGTLTGAITEISGDLFDLVARLEASIDFPEEGYHFVERGQAESEIRRLAARAETLLADGPRGRLVRDGAVAVILGRPNTGKSSLFNSLVGFNRVIVTARPGTTRDSVTEQAEIGGVPITLVDTAGIRETTDEVELESISRARAARERADVSLVVLDRSRPLGALDREVLHTTASVPRVVVVNKCDLAPRWSVADLHIDAPLEVSLKTGESVASVGPAVLAALCSGEVLRDSPAISNTRHIDLLGRALQALGDAAARAAEGMPEEFVLADLHRAVVALEEITGRRTPEATLEHIFSRFCVGK